MNSLNWITNRQPISQPNEIKHIFLDLSNPDVILLNSVNIEQKIICDGEFSILKFEQKSDVEVTLPSFKLESQLNLVEPLKQLGMTDMFDGAKADFSGMTGGTNKGLFVSQVVQKAFVEVKEEGTEAAAATFTGFCTSSSYSPPPPPRFTCDRPFMFLIRDNLTGMILFSGHVTDPSK